MFQNEKSDYYPVKIKIYLQYVSLIAGNHLKED